MNENIRKLHCVKLNKIAPGLKRPPVPGEFGRRIYENISQEAWQQWLQRQTMFINEHRLNLTDADAREFLQAQMQAFLFDHADNKPIDFVSPEKTIEKLD